MIEPAAGLTRALMAFLVDAYPEDEAPNTKGGVDKRTVLKLDPRLAPVKVAVLPLSRNEELSPMARDLAADAAQALERRLRRRRAIGRRYRRQDEIGTPFCVTVDFDTLEDDAVTDPRARHDDAGAGRPGPGDRLPGDASVAADSRDLLASAGSGGIGGSIRPSSGSQTRQPPHPHRRPSARCRRCV